MFDALADRDFKGALRYALPRDDHDEFQQRYWEMFLAHHLKRLGHSITRKRSGPDFRFESGGKTVWVEAVAPKRSEDIDAFYKAEMANRGGWFRADIFHLRWTQAIRDKVNKYSQYLRDGSVGTHDVCIIAVNSALLGSLGMVGKSDYPALVDVVFGAGAQYVRIDTASMEIVDNGYQREPVIKKKDSEVAKQFFLEPNTSHISAILGSGASPEMQSPIIAVHNPLARNSLPLERLGAEWEYYAEDCGNHYEVKGVRSRTAP